jgi:RHS repeat-associated protein
MITQALNRNRRKFLLLVLLWLIPFLSALAGTPTVTYIYTDPQGTPLAETDALGNVTATFDYRPYGSQALGTPPKGPGYTGHVNDPDTGLVYMQARYYDPAVGRFLSADPVASQAGNLINFNVYSYASSNPVRKVDPSGMLVEDPTHDQSQDPGPFPTCGREPGSCRNDVFHEFALDGDGDSGSSPGGFINQLNVGNDAHKTLQAYAISTASWIFAEKWYGPEGEFFGGRPDIGNSDSRELWEIKSDKQALLGAVQVQYYASMSGAYEPGHLPSFFHGSTGLTLSGKYATYEYTFVGNGVITYSTKIKSEYQYRVIPVRNIQNNPDNIHIFMPIPAPTPELVLGVP